MSELKTVLKIHREQIKILQGKCEHPEEMIKIHLDRTHVGRGCIYAAFHIVCRNCGKMKVIYPENHEESNRQPKKTLDNQGFKDERDSHIGNREYYLD